MILNKVERKTIDEYLQHDLVFPYINNICVYLDYPNDMETLNDIFDDYNKYIKKYIPYIAKYKTLVDFTKRVKQYNNNLYTSYEDLT